MVRAVGSRVSLFKPGDRVWYAGALDRPGANSELHAVDERIVGRMPDSLDYAQAAALPLTTITAWELLFDRLRVLDNALPSQQSLLVVGAAGGVGSILVQLARQLTGLTVIGTASRPQTQAWVRELGAHHVIDHGQPLAEELRRIGINEVSHIASLTHSDQHFAQIAEAIAPQGRIALIDDPAALDVRLLKRKSASLHWEFMFARPLHQTPDMIAQHELLNQAARLIDQGRLRTTLGEHYGTINAANLRRAHAFIESGRAQGRWCWKASDSQGRSPGRPPAGFLRRATRITTRKRLKPRLRDARWQPRTVRRTPLLAHMLDQALEPSLWAMVALTLLLLRFVPLQGWLAVLVAGTTSGLILDTIQFRVGPPRLWDALVCASVLAALLVAALLEALYALFRRYRGGKLPR